MSPRLQPAVLGGVLIGVLSALPIIQFGNCCCCLWVLLGGGVAAYLRQQNSPYQITAAEGALVGLIAGAVGAVVTAVLSIPIQMVVGPFQQQYLERFLSGNADVPPEVRDVLERASVNSGLRIVSLLTSIVIDSVFGVLGGLLGVAIFKKNLPPPPPPGTIDVVPTPYVPPAPPLGTPPSPPPPPSV